MRRSVQRSIKMDDEITPIWGPGVFEELMEIWTAYNAVWKQMINHLCLSGVYCVPPDPKDFKTKPGL